MTSLAGGPSPAPEGGDLIAAMAEPSFYPHKPEEVERRETPISWVFLAEDLVYKVKKPVDLSFLDYGTLERRRFMCEEEVRLNRRLAPDYYLGVRSIVSADGSFRLGSAEERGATEYVVEMRRLPLDRAADRLLEAGELHTGDVQRVARRLAAFHADADPAPEERSTATCTKCMVDAEFAELFGLVEAPGERRRVVAAERFADAFLAARRAQLVERGRARRVRDGHGDLRLEHVVLDDGVQVFDCVEFDPALRQIDVAADLAYLVMDLVSREAEQLAGEIVRAYREAGGDPGDDALLAFWAAYRACVRAKLAYLQAAEQPVGRSAHEEALAKGSELLALAERFRWRARLPLVLVTCGIAASGKSVLAQSLADASGLSRLTSDPTRKRLAGIASTEPARPEHYSDAFNERTYRELGRTAAAEVERTGGAIVDATFRRLADREAFRAGLGEELAPIFFVECRAPAAVLAERARTRAEDRERVSDATPEVVAAQQREFAPLDEVASSRHVVVRTDREVAKAIDDLETQLDSKLTEPT